MYRNVVRVWGVHSTPEYTVRRSCDEFRAEDQCLQVEERKGLTLRVDNDASKA